MITDKVKQLIRAEIRNVSSYHVPVAEGMIKMDAMENPYSWPEAMKVAWLEKLHELAVNRYPDASCRHLEVLLRQVMQIPDTLAVLFGNGSDELIQIICMALMDNKTRDTVSNTVLSVTPSFVMYHMIANFLGMNHEGVPLKSDFSLDTEVLLTSIARCKPAVIFIAYPNNPTGNLFDEQILLKIIEQAPGLIVIDEAYHPFAKKSFLHKVLQHEQLLVMRTVSKMGLAGLRLGYLIGHPKWLSELNKVRLPYNINVLTQVSAEFAFQNIGELDRQAKLIRAARETLYADLQSIKNIQVYPSAANFILFRTPDNQAAEIDKGLRERNLLIKNLDSTSPFLKDCLRVTVSTPEENAVFLKALREVLDCQ